MQTAHNNKNDLREQVGGVKSGDERKVLVFACGGTSGHINPAISVAEYVREHYPQYRIIFCGTAEGLESKLVAQARFEFIAINAKPFHRNIKAVLKAAYTLFTSRLKLKKLLKTLRPAVVFGTGGYVCAPVLSAAKALGIKIVIHEQNAFPGKSNLFLSKQADLLCYSFAETAQRFKGAKRLLLTGNPVPQRFFEQNKEEAKRHLGLQPEQRYVLVVGGSLGAKRLNDAVFAWAKKYKEAGKVPPYRLIAALGARGAADYVEETKLYADLLDCKSYIYNMEEYYAACDLVVCRAGALTLAELAAVGRPALFVPYPYAAEDHQTYNAGVFVSNGAALLCKDEEMNAERLERELQFLFKDAARLDEMGNNAKKLAYAEAAAVIAEEIVNLAEA